MPIRPNNVALYPPNWPAISLDIRANRAHWRCECDGRCDRRPSCTASDGRCPAIGKGPDRSTTVNGRGKVTLTVAHLNHTPADCRPENLMAMCQACHLAYDADHHASTRAATREAELAATMDPLFPLEMP